MSFNFIMDQVKNANKWQYFGLNWNDKGSVTEVNLYATAGRP